MSKSLPHILQKRLESARCEIIENFNHDLSWSACNRIIATFGPRLATTPCMEPLTPNLYYLYDVAVRENSSDSFEAELGWRRRVWNGIFCLKEVLPLWSKEFPQRDLPDRILSFAKARAEDTMTYEHFHESRRGLSEEIKNWDFSFPESASFQRRQACGVGTTAISLFYLTLREPNFIFDIDLDYYLGELPLKYPQWEVEADIEVGDIESSACWAVSGSTPGFESCKPEFNLLDERLKFWTWWLDEAVPLAYNLGKL